MFFCTQALSNGPRPQVKPEAKTYYELAAATLRFKFPEPGFLDGIRGKTQAIAKMTNLRQL